MKHNLTSRPNLEHLRGQAKGLLTAWQAGNAEAAATLIDHLPSAKGNSTASLVAENIRLADAQLAIARKSGFASWPKLAHYVEQLRALEGDWQFTALEVDGKTISAGMIANARILMDGDKFRCESTEANYDGEFLINVDVSPHTIDIQFVSGPEAGNWSYGIYKLDGDNLTICLGLTGFPRPLDFVMTPNSGHALETLRRMTAERPAGVTGGSAHSAQSEVQNESDVHFEITTMHERLQGKWSAVSIIRDGMELPASYLSSAQRLSEGAQVTIKMMGQVMTKGRTVINATRLPIEVDNHLEGPGQSGLVQYGILQWVGEDVLFCYGSARMPRPVEFTCDPGSGRTLSLWRKSS